MKISRSSIVSVALGLLVLTLAACAGRDGTAQPGQLVYGGVTEKAIPAGGFLPGTGVQYVGPVEGKGAEMRIDGQTAYKKAADSLDWEGSPAPGVTMDVGQRVLFFGDQAMRVGGNVRFAIDGAAPQPLPERPTSAIEYRIPVTYNVNVGEAVPGTTLVLQSIDPDKGALFAGWATDQYPYRKSADSMQWQGALRPGVALALDARVAWIGEDSVRLAGFADLIFSQG